MTELSPFLDLTRSPLEGAGTKVIQTPSSGVPFWGEDPISWDTVFIAGVRLPGLAKVTGNTKRRHVKKNVPGKHGSTVTFTGDEPTEFTVTVRLWTPEHLADFAKVVQFLKSLKPVEETTETVSTKSARPSASNGASFSSASSGSGFVSYDVGFETTKQTVKKVRVNPVSVSHPALALHGIASAFVTEIGLLSESGGRDGSGVYESRLACIECMPDALRQNGGVVTPKPQATSLGSLGQGAIAKKPTKPSQTNAGPGL